MAIEEKGQHMGFNITGAAFGVFIGVCTGVVLGALYTPKSGKETRQQLAEWYHEKRDQGSDLLARIKAEGLHRQAQLAATIKAGKHAYAEAMRQG